MKQYINTITCYLSNAFTNFKLQNLLIGFNNKSIKSSYFPELFLAKKSIMQYKTLNIGLKFLYFNNQFPKEIIQKKILRNWRMIVQNIQETIKHTYL